jgi:hypothetical protein
MDGPKAPMEIDFDHGTLIGFLVLTVLFCIIIVFTRNGDDE